MNFNYKSFLFIGIGLCSIAGRSFAASEAQKLIVKVDNKASLNFILSNAPQKSLLGALSFGEQLSENTYLLRYSTNLKGTEAAKDLMRGMGGAQVVWAQPNFILKVIGNAAEKSAPVFSPFAKVLKNLASDPGYVAAPPLPNPAQNDPQMNQLWGLKKINVEGAWSHTQGNRAIVVADIDTGVDYTHPDLVNNMWRNPNPNAPDQSGYDFVSNDPFPFDDFGHGTHTAGTIGATGGNGVGIAGVSPAVAIMAIKFIAKSGEGTTADAIKSIDYAIANKARIMSNSWGGPAEEDDIENKALEEAVARAGEADILFVAAAGNDGSNNDEVPMYPAAIRQEHVLSVASTNSDDRRSFFSNYGPETVHVGAPGSNILSTVPNGAYEMMSGTSMACPHVAGLAALILSVNPSLRATEVKQIIMGSVDTLPALQGKVVTGGRINTRAAIEKALTL